MSKHDVKPATETEAAAEAKVAEIAAAEVAAADQGTQPVAATLPIFGAKLTRRQERAMMRSLRTSFQTFLINKQVSADELHTAMMKLDTAAVAQVFAMPEVSGNVEVMQFVGEVAGMADVGAIDWSRALELFQKFIAFWQSPTGKMILQLLMQLLLGL